MTVTDLLGEVRHFNIMRGQSVGVEFPIQTLAGEEATLAGLTAHGFVRSQTDGSDIGGAFAVAGSSVIFSLTADEASAAGPVWDFQIELRDTAVYSVVRGSLLLSNDLVDQPEGLTGSIRANFVADPVRVVGLSSSAIAWLLEAGTWADSGVWDDSQTWNDGA